MDDKQQDSYDIYVRAKKQNNKDFVQKQILINEDKLKTTKAIEKDMDWVSAHDERMKFENEKSRRKEQRKKT